MTDREQPLGDRLRDGALPSSSKPIQPVDGGPVEVSCPEFDTIQDGSACSLETTLALAMSKLGAICTVEIIEDCRNCCRISRQTPVIGYRELSDLHPVEKVTPFIRT